MKHFKENNEFDQGLRSLNNKFRISEKEEESILNEINRNIDGNVSTHNRKPSQWKYYIAAAAAVFILIILAIPIFNHTHEDLAGSDELSGKTFKVASHSPELPIDNPNRYNPILTVEFLDGNVFNNPIYGEGTYELKDDVLVLQFENENESLKISFNVEESELNFSMYSGVISDVEFEMRESTRLSYFNNLFLSLALDMPVEFLKE